MALLLPALKEYPNEPVLFTDLARAYYDLGKLDDAEASLNKAQGLLLAQRDRGKNIDQAFIDNLLGFVNRDFARIACKKNDRISAEKFFKEALKRSDRNPIIWKSYAHFLQDGGQIRESKEALEKAATLEKQELQFREDVILTVPTILRNSPFKYQKNDSQGEAYDCR
ncbi:MAG: tetratricopeptide repeat protein [Cyanobacteria bacterium SZAS TMP-1]|nr:tetratricopeptide repeat protein [Cyanobacteria bacterium SZAS TMP-1]